MADFDVSSDYENFGVCKGNIYTDQVTITNTYPEAREFQLWQSNEKLSPYTTIVPDNIVLGPFESITINHIFLPKRDARGNYISELLIETQGQQKILRQEVDFPVCDNMQLNVDESTFSNCPCVSTIYSFEIQNTGDFADRFTLSMDLNERFYTLSEELIYLEPSETKTIYAYVRMPCEVSGDYTFNLVSQSRGSGLTKKAPLYLNLRKECYGFNFYLGNSTKNLTAPFIARENKSYNINLNDSYYIPFAVENTGEFDNYHLIDAKIPRFMEVNWAGEEIAVNDTSYGHIFVNATNVTSKSSTAELTIKSQVGYYEKDYEITVNVIGFEDDDFNYYLIYFGILVLLLLILIFVIFYLSTYQKEDSFSGDDTATSASKKPAVSNDFRDESEEFSQEFPWKPIILIIAIALLLVLFLVALIWFLWPFLTQISTEGLSPAINETFENVTVNETGDAQRAPPQETIPLNETPWLNATNISLDGENVSLTNMTNETGIFAPIASAYGYMADNWIYLLYAFLIIVIIVLLILAFVFHNRIFTWLEGTGYKNKILGLLLIIAGLIILLFIFLNYGPSGNDIVDDDWVNDTNITEEYPEDIPEEPLEDESFNFEIFYILLLLLFIFLVFILIQFGFKENIYKYFILILAIVLLFLVAIFFYYISLERDAISQQREDLTNETLIDGETIHEDDFLVPYSTEENSTNYVWRKNTEKIIDFGPHIKTHGDFNFTLNSTQPQNITITTSGSELVLNPDEGWYGVRTINLIVEDELGSRSYSPDITLVVLNRGPWYEELWEGTKAFLSNFYSYLIFLFLLVAIVSTIIVSYVRYESEN